MEKKRPTCIGYNYLVSIFLVVFVISITGCKKQKNDTPDIPVTKSDNYTSKINGSWIGKGNGHAHPYGYGGDAFLEFKAIRVSDTEVFVLGDTLDFDGTDSIAQTVFFTRLVEGHKFYERTRLIYSYSNNSMSYSYYFSGSGGASSTAGRTLDFIAQPNYVNSTVKNYISKIAGIRHLTGMCYDTVRGYTLEDTAYTIDEHVLFSEVKGGALTCKPVFLNSQVEELYYKSLDENAKTITFQSSHYPDYYGTSYSTLIYNYEYDTLTFEWIKVGDSFHFGSIKLH